MKRFLLIALLSIVALGFVGATDIDLGDFPKGTWVDHNYDAVWEFSGDNIRILDMDGTLIWDFAGKTIEGFNFGMNGDTYVVTFSCPEAGRTYKFTKPLVNTDLIMDFTRNEMEYKVKMTIKVD